MRWAWVIIPFAAISLYHAWITRPVHHAPGVLVAEEPEQTLIRADSAQTFDVNGFHVTPLASYHIRARVLSIESYMLGRFARLSSIDFAVGWGPMSDTAVIEKLSISQSQRFYWYSWRRNAPPIPVGEIISHSSNMHLIPADDTVAGQIGHVRKGQIVTLTGKLIRAAADDGWKTVSSLSRTDTGAGACEIMWVESVEASDS